MAIRKPRRKSNRQLWIMLALIVVIVAAIALLPSGNGSAEENEDYLATTLARAGEEAPDFTVGMFDGSTVTLSDLRGKVVLLNFWATWCPPCREELTHVQSEIIDRFAGREFLFLPVSRGETRQEVAAFREKTGYGFPMGLDSTRAVYDRYASNYIPRNFLIDADGQIIKTTVGFKQEEFDELILAIEAALAQAEQTGAEE